MVATKSGVEKRLLTDVFAAAVATQSHHCT